jgi:hypothetical protein
MLGIARAVARGLPHHITQRGNYGQVIFETDQDYRVPSTVFCKCSQGLIHLFPGENKRVRFTLLITRRSLW